MFKSKNFTTGFEITEISSCRFENLDKISNIEVLKRADKNDPRLASFMEKKMGIKNRYWTTDNIFAFDLAKEALAELIEKESSLPEEADFLIFCGISNSLPTVCHASLLACEFGFKKASCFDLKSGCSTGVLGLIQGLTWIQHGSKKGVIVCAETLSKLSKASNIQASGSVGDGAVAFSIKQNDDYEVLSVTQGTDPQYFKSMYVHGEFPVPTDQYQRENYYFTLEENSKALEKSVYHWQHSLKESLEFAEINGADIDYYIPHQVDGNKNPELAMSAGIKKEAIFMNFEEFGNMGCPSIFLNYMSNKDKIKPKSNEAIMFHAVGGGQSWASIIMRKK